MRLHFDTEGSVLSDSQRLAQTVYPGAEVSNSAYLDWQYRQNPDGEAILHAEKDDHGLTAQFVLAPRTFVISGRVLKGAVSINTITREDRRGEGLFKRLATEAYHELDSSAVRFITGFPNRDSMDGFTGSLGYRMIGTLPFLVKPLKWIPLLSHLLRRNRLRKGGDTGFAVSSASVFRCEQWVVSVCDSEDVRMRELLSVVNRKRGCAALRTPEYLKWRYADCPTRSYRILAVSDAREKVFRAYAVLRGVELMGWRCGAVVDLGCNSSQEDIAALRFLLTVAMEKFRQQSSALAISACSAGSEEYVALQQAGFLPVPRFLLPQPLHFILKTAPSAGSSDSMDDFRKWFLTFGDYDVV